VALQIGDTVADYQILGILGQGGMGAVYHVRSLLSGREEAMKVVLPGYTSEAEAADRFLREIKIQASLQHPNIVALRAAVRAGHEILMIMELVEGTSLKALLQRGRLPVEQSIRIADDILGALGYAHQRGVVHRDVKPANILVSTRGLPKLMDFGIARAPGDDKITQTGMAVGSLHYMSPEQAVSKPVDQRSDIYSMGATFYEMLTARPPFDGESQYSILNAHLTKMAAQPADLAPVSRELSDVVMKSLAKSPEERFQTAREFQDALRESLFGASPAQIIPIVPPKPKFEQTDLSRVESRLAQSVGPIARTLVAQAASRHSTMTGLCRELSEQIPNAVDRDEFLRATGAESGPHAVPLDDRTLEAASKALAVYLGPMAAMVVKKASRSAQSKEQLKIMLAAEIHDERARRDFLAAF
jgi:serine/threonine-protein kinase